jgi:hypothetical protein
MRALGLILIAVLAALPVVMHPTTGFAEVAALAGGLCATGTLARWRPLVTAGGSLTLIQYTVALISLPSRPVSAIVLGVGLALVLDVFEFVSRFHGAAVTPRALRRQTRHWIGSALLGALTGVVLAAVTGFVRVSGPPALYPLLAAVGALAAAGGVAGAVWRRRQDSG